MGRRIHSIRAGAMALLMGMGVASCATKHPVAPTPAPMPAPDVRAQAALVPPATFVGEMPCKACGEMRRTLTLLADGSYRLRQQYGSSHGGAGLVVHELGRWQLDGRRLTLRSENGRTGNYQLADSTRLEQLGREGELLTGNMAYALSRAAQIDPIAESMRVTGILDPKAGRLALCGTGQSVAILGDASETAALTRVLRETQSEGGLWVAIQAEWVEARSQGTAHGQPALRMERLLTTRPGQTCPATVTPGPAG